MQKIHANREMLQTNYENRQGKASWTVPEQGQNKSEGPRPGFSLASLDLAGQVQQARVCPKLHARFRLLR
jgi:hypothetical protein